MTKPKTNSDWLPFIGCSAWFNPKDAFLEIAPYAKVHSFTAGFGGFGGVGPVWTVVGQKGRNLLISANMAQVTSQPKKYVRILAERAA